MVEKDPFEIDGIDRKILQILVDHPELSNVKIAEVLKVHANTIGNRMAKPGFIKARADLMSTTDDLLKRAQKIAARRLLTMIKHPEAKIALEAIKLALAPLNNKRQVETKTEVIFQTRIGAQGQLMQEVIEVEPTDSKRKSDTSATQTTEEPPQDAVQDDPNGK